MDILCTTDYSIFDIEEGQRKVKPWHVDRLARSINKYGFLPSFPLSVTEDMALVDGQHRLKAAEKLGSPVYYKIVSERDDDLMLTLNRTSLNWSTDDYLNNFVSRDYEEYKKLKTLHETFGGKLSLASVLALCGSSAGAQSAYQAGRFKYPTDMVFENVLELVRILQPISKHFVKSSSIKALRKIAALDGYDQVWMKRKLIDLQSRLHNCPTTADYVEMYLSAYNYGRKSKEYKLFIED